MRGVRTLLVAIGIVGLANAIIGLAVRRQFDPGAADYLAAGAPDGVRMITEISDALSYNVIGGTAAAVAVVPLVIALGKPRSWASTATAVALGVNLLGLMIFMAANPTSYAEPGRPASMLARPLWDNLVPDWYGPSFYALELLMAALSVTAAVLLFRSSSREYFADGIRDPDDRHPTSRAPFPATS